MSVRIVSVFFCLVDKAHYSISRLSQALISGCSLQKADYLNSFHVRDKGGFMTGPPAGDLGGLTLRFHLVGCLASCER